MKYKAIAMFGNAHVRRLKQSPTGANDLDATIAQVQVFQLDGQCDEDWIPRIAREGWVVISSDRGKGGLKRGMPLPRLCVQWRVTHVLLWPAVSSGKSDD